MNSIEATAKEHELSPAKMLDRMVDDWIQAAHPESESESESKKKKKGVPWYLQ